MSGKGISGIVALCLGCIVAGALGYGAFLQPDPIDVDKLYCEATADGWRAAHIRLYDYVQATNREYFDRAFQPLTPGGREKLVQACLDDPEGTRKILGEILTRGEPVGAPNGK